MRNIYRHKDTYVLPTHTSMHEHIVTHKRYIDQKNSILSDRYQSIPTEPKPAALYGSAIMRDGRQVGYINPCISLGAYFYGEESACVLGSHVI